MKRQKKTLKEKQLASQKLKQKQNRGVQKKVSSKTLIVWMIIISVITSIAYYPALDNELTSWDDENYILKNEYLREFSMENTKKIFTTKSFMGNYHPLAILSLNIDYQIGGDDENGEPAPFIFHFVNLIIHLLVTLLVFWFVKEIFPDIKIAIIVALLFGVHTLHVESVAWVSERKDVLYALFFVLSLIFYVKYLKTQKITALIISIVIFILSLLSKGQAVSLAISIFALDFLFKRNFKDAKLYIEKIPFLLLAIIFGLLAISAQAESKAIVSGEAYNIFQRVAIASFAFVSYIIQLILPVNLSAIYPYPDIINTKLTPIYWVSILPVVLFFYGFYLAFKKSKEITFAILFFSINIALLLQFIPVGSAVHADRYVYIPSIGFFILIALFVNKIFTEKNKMIIYSGIGIYALLLVFLTFQRCDIWQSSETLWTDTANKSPKAVVAWNNLGGVVNKKAENALANNQSKKSLQLRILAAKYFSKAIKGKPDYEHAFYNRGVSYYETYKLLPDTIYINSALRDFTKALRKDSRFIEAYHNRGNVYSELGKFDNALKDLDNAVILEPNNSNFYSSRGVVKGKMGKLDDAIKDFDKSIRLDPQNDIAYTNRGLAKAMKKDYKNAIIDYDMSYKLAPKKFRNLLNRALAKVSLKMYKEALDDCDKVIALGVKVDEANYRKGLIYLEMKNKDAACKSFKKASDLGNRFAKQYYLKICGQ